MKYARAFKWLWIGVSPFALYVLAMLVYHGAWATGLLQENPSGLPPLFGHELSFFVCGAAPFAWIGVTVLALKGRLPGTRRRKQGACPACGYDLIDIRSGPCPECGAGAAHAPDRSGAGAAGTGPRRDACE